MSFATMKKYSEAHPSPLPLSRKERESLRHERAAVRSCGIW
jgi:hypothetical protein